MANYETVQAILNHPNVLQKSFQDVIATRATLVWWLLGKQVDTGSGLKPKGKKFVMELDGGSAFEVPLMLETNPNLKAFAKDASFGLTSNNLGDRATYPIKSLGGPIPVYRFDIDVSASSKTNLINCTKSFLEQANTGLINLINTQTWATAGGEGANDWSSILTLIPEDPTADSIGGVSAAAYSNWRNVYYDANAKSIATYLKGYLTKYKVQATVGANKPTFAIMNDSLYSDLDTQLVANQRFAAPAPDVEAAGFTGLRYGGMTVMHDNNCPAGSILGINENGILMGILKGTNMEVDPFVLVPGTDLMTSFVRLRGNYLLKDRRTHYHIFDLETA